MAARQLSIDKNLYSRQNANVTREVLYRDVPDMTEYSTAVSYTPMTGTDRSFKSHKTTILLCLCWYPQRQFHLGVRKVGVRSLNRDVRNHGHREHSCHREPEESNRTNCRMLRIPRREESKSRWRSVEVYNAFG